MKFNAAAFLAGVSLTIGIITLTGFSISVLIGGNDVNLNTLFNAQLAFTAAFVCWKIKNSSKDVG